MKDTVERARKKNESLNDFLLFYESSEEHDLRIGRGEKSTFEFDDGDCEIEIEGGGEKGAKIEEGSRQGKAVEHELLEASTQLKFTGDLDLNVNGIQVTRYHFLAEKQRTGGNMRKMKVSNVTPDERAAGERIWYLWFDEYENGSRSLPEAW